ncbi:MAG: prolyl oligopeptidase family serine peptidase [Actinomycetes bacterium]
MAAPRVRHGFVARAVAACAAVGSIAGVSAIPSAAAPAADTTRVYQYPAAARSDQVDTYFGVNVADPYRYLEDPADPATKAWVSAESSLARDYLNTLPSHRERSAQIDALWQVTTYGPPLLRGSRQFWLESDGLRAQPVIYWANSSGGPRHVAIDPNLLSSDGGISLGEREPNPAGTLLAYSTSKGGSDWRTLHIRDLATGRDLPDVIEWAKFTDLCWARDGSGFYYSAYPKPANPLEQANVDHKLFFHRVGSSQSADRVVAADAVNPSVTFSCEQVRTSRRAWVDFSSDTSTNGLSWGLQGSSAPLTPLVADGRFSYTVLHDDATSVWVLTNDGAPNYRVVRIDLAHPDPASWVTVVPENSDALDDAIVVGDRIVANYLHDAKSQLVSVPLSGGSPRRVTLPGIGAVSGLRAGEGSTMYYMLSSFTAPRTIYGLDTKTGKSAVWRSSRVSYDPAQFVTEQVFVTSKDGTRVPAFLVHRRDVKPNGKVPTWLYGYGGFAIPVAPFYSPRVIAWLQSGGMYVMANLRGGGEYGSAWHEAGTKLSKQNVFDDFIATAQWLIDHRWTSTAHLGIEGRSNGGLLVGAALTQRPDLFGAAIPAVGVLDMLRYQNFTIGAAWASDYGRSDDSLEMFRYLLGYSPLHNVRPGVAYPATMIMTAARDDRVVPAHSYKFGATMQADTAGPQPVIVRIQQNAGHGAGASTEQAKLEAVDMLSFFDAHIGNAPVVPTPTFIRAPK